ncbi:aminoacyl-tRNA hydrolase [Chitinispirillales bacterium ANBcel5]|uniref:aminoacyl-tRNA hydrolase n=1 Tax=Cellulosispirillum alkaliphilum TaxID=3039283 RepID=UPI002A4EBF78|nr:aminoacyl-tRNA hydrolase [Chitinispirillales bacterium ANBcel5]
MNILKLFGILSGKKTPKFKPQKLIAGLGNPGDEYHNTRHNVGFMISDRLGSILNEQLKFSAYNSECKSGFANEQPVLLIKPQTYMNRSGSAIETAVEDYSLSASDVLVIVDDFNLPLGTLRFRRGGSHGGHNGLKSIISQIGSDFSRLRVGIGPLPTNSAVIDFVLGDFSETEMQLVDKVISKAVIAIQFMLKNGLDSAMNEYNSLVIE